MHQIWLIGHAQLVYTALSQKGICKSQVHSCSVQFPEKAVPEDKENKTKNQTSHARHGSKYLHHSQHSTEQWKESLNSDCLYWKAVVNRNTSMFKRWVSLTILTWPRYLISFTKPTSLKHGDGFLICSSIAHLTVACRIFPSYSLELWVPLGVPLDRS